MDEVSPSKENVFNFGIPSPILYEMYGSQEAGTIELNEYLASVGTQDYESSFESVTGKIPRKTYSLGEVVRSQSKKWGDFVKASVNFKPLAIRFFVPERKITHYISSVRSLIFFDIPDTVKTIDGLYYLARKNILNILNENANYWSSYNLKITVNKVFAENIHYTSDEEYRSSYLIPVIGDFTLDPTPNMSGMELVTHNAPLDVYAKLSPHGVHLAWEGLDRMTGFFIERGSEEIGYVHGLKSNFFMDTTIGESTETYSIAPIYQISINEGKIATPATTEKITGISVKPVKVKIADEYDIDYSKSGLVKISQVKDVQQPFMFEVKMAGIASKNNYSGFAEVKPSVLPIVEAVHKDHDAILHETSAMIAKPWDELKNKASATITLAFPHSPADVNFANGDQIEKDWNAFAMLDNAMGSLPFFFGKYQSTSMDIYRTGVYPQLMKFVKSLSDKLDLDKNGWGILRCVISDIKTIDHEGKTYVDEIRILFAFTPVKADATPYTFTDESGYAGLGTKAVLSAIIGGLLENFWSLVLLSGAIVLANSVTRLVGTAQKAGVNLSSMLMIGGIGAVAILILWYYLKHPGGENG